MPGVKTPSRSTSGAEACLPSSTIAKMGSSMGGAPARPALKMLLPAM